MLLAAARTDQRTHFRVPFVLLYSSLGHERSTKIFLI
jgi:hypothetical protein